VSADWYVGGEWRANSTHNLGPMGRAAGYPGHALMDGAPVTEAGGVFRKVAEALRSDPERFRAMNPENGWGTYEGLVEVMDTLALACVQADSSARVEVSW
jgi:hypothetical protein